MKKYVFAITGASGSVLGIRVLKELLNKDEVHLIISSQSFQIIEHETGIDFTKTGPFGKRQGQESRCSVKAQNKDNRDCRPGAGKGFEEGARDIEKAVRGYFKTERLFFYDNRDMSAPVASGSFRTDGMFVVPCSMKTLSGIANGYANNLIERAADVMIKESRPLLLSPREMPFSAIHLENMLKLARLGVRIAPPVPAFYHKPETLDDIIDFLAGKLLDSFNIEHKLFRRWRG